MRVLFSCVSGYGHFHPLVPLAQAFRERGDTVAVAAAGSHAPQVELAGLQLLPTGLDEAEVNARFAPAKAHSETLPIPDRRRYVFSQRFALIEAPARVDALREQARAFRADMIVHDASELAAPVVGAQLGVTTVHHSFGRMIPGTTIDAATVEVAPLWERAGVEPEPQAGNDPAELSAVPANATVERFVPQNEVLPRSSLIVTHAGSGSMLGALAHGIPLLAVPHAADQFENAAAVSAAGAALVVMPNELSGVAIRDAARALLEDPEHRDAARAIAAEIAAMPSAAQVAQQLEEHCRA